MHPLYDLPGLGSRQAEWEWLRQEENTNVRRECAEAFQQIFPEGHNTSLREFVQKRGREQRAGYLFSKDDLLQFLDEVHPDAFEIIATYGKDYTPRPWKSAPAEPKEESCFENAWLLAHVDAQGAAEVMGQSEPIVYVEGIVFGSLVRPMLHAWNTCGLQGAEAIDWTQYPVCEWSRYFGIPFTVSEVEGIYRKCRPGFVGSLFHTTVFNKHMNDCIVELLKKRTV